MCDIRGNVWSTARCTASPRKWPEKWERLQLSIFLSAFWKIRNDFFEDWTLEEVCRGSLSDFCWKHEHCLFHRADWINLHLQRVPVNGFAKMNRRRITYTYPHKKLLRKLNDFCSSAFSRSSSFLYHSPLIEIALRGCTVRSKWPVMLRFPLC